MSNHIRTQFPFFNLSVGSPPWVYLDSAATTQKPQYVLNAITEYYHTSNANVHRAAHGLAAKATTQIEDIRQQITTWIHAADSSEIVFTAGTTASFNLVAWSYGEQYIQPGDEILVSVMEHHSNWLPWQVLCKRKGAILKVIPLTPEGTLDRNAYTKLLNKRTKLVALTYVSNVLGTVNPLQEMIAQAHTVKAVVVVDATQAIGHMPVDVTQLDSDFLAFSSHKMYGPTGVGVLYGKKQHLASMIPYQVGGGMVQQLDPTSITYEKPPYRFEAGTLPIASIVGLGAACTFLEEIGYPRLQAHEQQLIHHTYTTLQHIPGLRLLGKPKNRLGIFSFIIDGLHDLDIGIQLDVRHIAVRTGTHCAIPLIQALDVTGTVRISLGVYNTLQDIDRLGAALQKIVTKVTGKKVSLGNTIDHL